GSLCPPSGPQPPNTLTETPEDGSSYKITMDIAGSNSIGGTVFDGVGGTLFVPWLTSPPAQANDFSDVDANGNTISFNGSTGQFTDTLGQTVLTVGGVNPATYIYTAPSGANAVWNINYSTQNVKTNFGCSQIGEYNGNGVPL